MKHIFEDDSANFTFTMNCKDDDGSNLNQTDVNSTCHDDVSILSEVNFCNQTIILRMMATVPSWIDVLFVGGIQ